MSQPPTPASRTVPLARRPAVFLDRDDTVCENRTLPDEAWPGKPGDLFLPEWVRLLPGAARACAALHEAGFLIVLVTNQAGYARGSASLSQIDATNERLRELVGRDREGRFLIRACYSGLGHPDAAGVPGRAHVAGEASDEGRSHPASVWRKPGARMILAAEADLRLDLARSWLVGDKARDVECGVLAGLDPSRCLRVHPPLRPGEMLEDLERAEGRGPADAADLAAAARLILTREGFASRAGPAAEVASAAAGSPVAREGDASSMAPRASAAVLHEVISPASRVRLAAIRAASHGGDRSTPLADGAVRETVLSAARAIAERTGVRLLELGATDSEVRALLATHRLAALGFASELRRATNRWYRGRTGALLWPSADDDDGPPRGPGGRGDGAGPGTRPDAKPGGAPGLGGGPCILEDEFFDEPGPSAGGAAG